MYAIYSNNIIDRKINVDMDIIVENILQSAEHVSAIVLTGGFGRDEGSVLLDGEKCQPLNDYDVTVIAETWHEGLDLDAKRVELASLCGIRQVDLALISQKSLPKLKLSMLNYDLVNASKVIYGDHDWAKKAPKWNACDLPYKEGVKPLFLFLSSILQAYPQSNEMSHEELFWSYQQSTKAVLGWSTAMLVFDGLYDPSYQNRNLLFQNKYSEKKELCELVSKATAFKLKPNASPCNQDGLNEFWSLTKEAHLDVMKDLIPKFYNTKFTNWERLVLRHKLSFSSIAKKALSVLFSRHHYENCLNIDIAKLFMCLSLDSDNEYFFNKSRAHYKKLMLTEKLNTPSKDREQYLRQLITTDINARIFFEQGNAIYYE